ncbi:MAG: prepilin-type N-terminal cleavage/methylation domain-containing protein [Lentisphaeria bacterium]|nr:prepilin-type N-terminal cleavage/methylation domain-containing protein [Lentisphaeria bacterium]
MFPRPRQQAFTLLELLVAAMAGAALMAALLTTMAGAWRLQEQGQEREAAEVPLDLARRRLAAELAAAVPPAGILAAPLLATAEEEGEWRLDDVQWVAAIGARDPEDLSGDLVEVRYYLVESENGDARTLVRTARANLLTVEEEEPEEMVILDDVVSFAASWYSDGTWVDSWDSSAEENRLPEAVRIRIDFAEADGRTPPPLELLVPLLMQTVRAEEGAP